MNELKKLLEGVKVDRKKLGVIANLITTGRLNANAMEENGMYPFFTCNERPYRINKFAFDLEAILISGNGSKVGHINYYNGKFNAYQRTYVIGKLNNEIKMMYLLHYLNFMLKNYIEVNSKKGSVPYITMPMLQNLQIPIPCPDNPEKSLKIQEEIVRILDNLSEETNQLTTALQKELQIHQNQYNFYREELFKFEGQEVEWKALGDVAELVRGNGLPKSDFTETGVPAIHYGQIYTFYKTFTTETKSFVSPETAIKLRKVDTGDVVITNTSENLADVGKAVAYLGNVQAVTGGHATIIKPSKDILGKYFAYFTQTEAFAIQKRKFAKGIKVIDVSASDMSKIKIPVPSQEEQERIVKILDDLDAKTLAITTAIKKEVALRNKQYEFYRDRLLSFSK